MWRSIQSEADRDTNLGDRNVLLCRKFYHFGDDLVLAPKVLHPIPHSTEGQPGPPRVRRGAADPRGYQSEGVFQ